MQAEIGDEQLTRLF